MMGVMLPPWKTTFTLVPLTLLTMFSPICNLKPFYTCICDIKSFLYGVMRDIISVIAKMVDLKSKLQIHGLIWIIFLVV